MSQWTLASGWPEIIPPQAIRGIAMGAMFVPLSTATLRALPGPLIAKGAGLFNLFRQLGGSLGVAILATTLDRRTTVHRVGLADQLSPLDPVAAQTLDSLARGFTSRGLDPEAARMAATASLDQMLSAQASMEAFNDIYGMLAVIFVLMLPLGMMIVRHAPGKYAPIE